MEPYQPAAPALRAADADREAVALVLRDAGGDGRLSVEEMEHRLAAALVARTHTELNVLTADLGVSGPTTSAAQVPTRVVTIMGGNRVDLSQLELTAAVTHIRVLTVMGGTEIDLADDLNVRISKLALMGGNEIIGTQPPSPPGAPELHIRLVSIMGGAKIRFVPRPGRHHPTELYA